MTLALVAFNVLVSAATSLLAAVLLSWLLAKLLRVGSGHFRVLLWSAPFAKALLELGRGVPDDAFFWAKLAGAAQESGSFSVGLGLTWPAIPVLDLSLGALFQGRRYDQSLSDLLQTALAQRVHALLPAWLGGVLVALTALSLLVHGWRRMRAARVARAALASSTLVEHHAVGPLRARILIAPTHSAVPFAGGVFRPWVCIPQRAYDALTVSERDAVIAHELGHLRHGDALTLGLSGFCGALFWYVPGVSVLVRAIRHECELAADAYAARLVGATQLASALLKVAELTRGNYVQAELALLTRRGPLAKRVGALLADAPPAPVASILTRMLRGLLCAVLLAGLMRATLLGYP